MAYEDFSTMWQILGNANSIILIAYKINHESLAPSFLLSPALF